MQLKLALQGKLTDTMESHYKNSARAVTLGIHIATDGLKLSMRGQVKSAGLSTRLANTWRGVVYPKSKQSIKAAGEVYSNAQKIMEDFEYQTVIKSTSGTWLALPTEAIPKKAMGKKITPALYEKMKGIRLTFIYRSRGCSLLIHTKKKKTVIAFLLVPQVKMPKLISFESESKRWQAKVPSLILRNWSEEDE